MSCPTHPSPKGAQSASVTDVSVIKAIGELLAAAARILDAEVVRRLGGPGLYRRLASILVAFLTFSIVMRVRQRASMAGHRFVITAGEAQRYLSHPPAGWAAP
ncbi:hypothetical protein [Sphingobium yanoikuyae]|uniref:hypothetical protein n=1 Tax=Sphingobium yanoikuyae TaxID=13690 RepID=UPI0026ED0ECF|nr:hypothetical protein [Sphingobium yanoikuyae]